MIAGPENKMNVLMIGGFMAATLGGVAVMAETNDAPEERVHQTAVSLPTPVAELNLVGEDPLPPHPTFVAPSPTHIPHLKPHTASRSRREYAAKPFVKNAKFLPISEADWQLIIDCESDGDPGAVYKGHYGILQFTLDTWHDVGGTGNPTKASVSEQRYRGYRLEADRGTQPWACALASINHRRNIVAKRNPNYLSRR